MESIFFYFFFLYFFFVFFFIQLYVVFYRNYEFAVIKTFLLKEALVQLLDQIVDLLL